jgi:hypothetical protein
MTGSWWYYSNHMSDIAREYGMAYNYGRPIIPSSSTSSSSSSQQQQEYESTHRSKYTDFSLVNGWRHRSLQPSILPYNTLVNRGVRVHDHDGDALQCAYSPPPASMGITEPILSEREQGEVDSSGRYWDDDDAQGKPSCTQSPPLPREYVLYHATC